MFEITDNILSFFFRTHILSDRSLQFTAVQVSDEGNYICRAENSVGFVETTFTLTVHCKIHCHVSLSLVLLTVHCKIRCHVSLSRVSFKRADFKLK